MRTVQVIIVRLLIDSGAPGMLRGTVQLVADDEARPFAGERPLLALLRGIAGGTAGEEDTAAGHPTEETHEAADC
jgi:hypothetical protein